LRLLCYIVFNNICISEKKLIIIFKEKKLIIINLNNIWVLQIVLNFYILIYYILNYYILLHIKNVLQIYRDYLLYINVLIYSSIERFNKLVGKTLRNFIE
jgi:hypothetical protein